MVVSSEVRIVGLVAGVAKHAAGVFGSVHLGEGLGFGGVLFVAAAAEAGDVGEFGLERRRIIGLGMGGLRTVAGLARDMGVAAGGTDFGLVLVAEDAGVLARVRNGARADQVEGVRPVVPVLAESFGDDGGADDEEESQGGEEDEGRADEVPGITHETFQAPTPFLASV
jgi:hypothetical protein